MNNRSGKWLTGLLAMLLLAVCRVSGATDLQQLVHETQRTAESGSQLTMAWWIPQEFWEASMSNNPNVTEESRTQLLQALEDYQIFVVVRAKTGIAGITDVQSKEDMSITRGLWWVVKPLIPLRRTNCQPVHKRCWPH